MELVSAPVLANTTTDNKARYFNCWKLQTDNGRQAWHFTAPDDINWNNPTERSQFLKEMSAAFTFDSRQNPNSGDKVYRQIAKNKGSNDHVKFDSKAYETAYKGVQCYKDLQADGGWWPGDYGGPQFLLPGLVVAAYITQTPFPDTHQILMQLYMLNHQNADGGWGLHIEGSSTMFGTVMQYVALRLLGISANEAWMLKAKAWIHDNGGATYIPPWGKFYLSLLGVYEWEGCDSLLPELWLLPDGLPIHPGNYWCHTRMVYMPMSYCYGHRITAPINELLLTLKQELYPEQYENIDWKKARAAIADTDVYTAPSKTFRKLNDWVINPFEKLGIESKRKQALDFALQYIDAEDQQTNYVNIGPVNQVINSICVWHAYGKDSQQFKKHVDRWNDYLWVAEDGMKMNGYNGSQLWDTTFALQAILEGGLGKHFPEVCEKAYGYIDRTQVQEELPVEDRNKFFRHESKGGWPFSTRDHGWPISDCTAEGLSSVLMAHHHGLVSTDKRIADNRLKDAADLLLGFQNKDGGWATYENTRSSPWIEFLNPSGIFGNIMIDYSYTECTSACVRALCEFREQYPDHKKAEIAKAIRRGQQFILSKQLPDGSWVGSWAVCFTYGTWFGIEGLMATGAPTDPKIKAAIDRACQFLVQHQMEDGGWGESYRSCEEQRYVQHESSQVIQTSWALLGLMAANYTDKQVIDRGLDLLMQRQQPNGDWPQESISGVFNNSCMITYTAYRNVFPLWALGRYIR